MITVYRCTICGEAHIASAKATHCPFCGAHEKWLVDAIDFQEPERVELTEISKKNLEFTFDLEIRASRIYQCIRKKTRDEYILGMFKTIAKVELEHAELVGKLIGRDTDCGIPFMDDLCTDDRTDSLDRTKVLEETAIRHYTTFLQEATEPRVKIIFQALLEAENDHLAIVRNNL